MKGLGQVRRHETTAAALKGGATKPVASERRRGFESLIENARLESRPSHRKLKPLRISNRERIAIFHPAPRLQWCSTNHRSRVTSHEFLIYGTAIKTPRKPFHYSNLKNSNRR